RAEKRDPERRGRPEVSGAALRVLAWHERIRPDEAVEGRTLRRERQLVEERREVRQDEGYRDEWNRGRRVVGVIRAVRDHVLKSICNRATTRLRSRRSPDHLRSCRPPSPARSQR